MWWLEGHGGGEIDAKWIDSAHPCGGAVKGGGESVAEDSAVVVGHGAGEGWDWEAGCWESPSGACDGGKEGGNTSGARFQLIDRAKAIATVMSDETREN